MYNFINEFNIKNINFDHTTTIDNFNWIESFGVSTNRFNITYDAFIIFRLISIFIILASFVSSVSDSIRDDCIYYWPIYLTHWNLCLSMCYIISGTIVTYNIHNFGDLYSEMIIPKYVQFHWLLQNPAFVTSIMIPVLFWPGCALSTIPPDSCYISQSPNTILVHGINSIIIVTDIIISNQPYMVLHGIYSICFAGMYLLWTYIHNVLEIGTCDHPNTDRPIYDLVDWNTNFNSITACVLMFFVPIVNFIGWYIYHKKTHQAKHELLV